MPQQALASFDSFATLVAATRAAKREAVQPSPFRANAGGPFLKPRSFDPGTPSLRACDAAAASVARSKADADAIRNAYKRFTSRG